MLYVLTCRSSHPSAPEIMTSFDFVDFSEDAAVSHAKSLSLAICRISNNYWDEFSLARGFTPDTKDIIADWLVPEPLRDRVIAHE